MSNYYIKVSSSGEGRMWLDADRFQPGRARKGVALAPDGTCEQCDDCGRPLSRAALRGRLDGAATTASLLCICGAIYKVHTPDACLACGDTDCARSASVGYEDGAMRHGDDRPVYDHECEEEG